MLTELKQPRTVGNTTFINDLPVNAKTVVALGIVIVNRKTGEELHVDALLEDGRISTTLAAVHKYFSADWGVFETFDLGF